MKKISPFAPALAALVLTASFFALHRSLAAGPPKVRVMVTEIAEPSTGKPEATPAPKVKGKGAAKPDAPKGIDDEMYVHSVTKALTVRVGNMTQTNLDVTVKTTFLGKDEAGKHEIVTEKEFENKISLAPGKSEEFKTEDVTYTHTTAHMPRVAARGGMMSKRPAGPPPQMEPASGHIYAGYKVEVFEGSDVVGSAQSMGM